MSVFGPTGFNLSDFFLRYSALHVYTVEFLSLYYVFFLKNLDLYVLGDDTLMS